MALGEVVTGGGLREILGIGNILFLDLGAGYTGC